MKHEKKILTISIILLITIISILIIYNLTQPPIGDLKAITYEEIIEKQANKQDFILIISQTTCSHCESYKPKIKQIAQKHGITVYYIDIDTLSNEDEFLKELNLSGATPITLFFKSGKETSILNRIEGDLSTKKIINQFKKMGFIS